MADKAKDETNKAQDETDKAQDETDKEAKDETNKAQDETDKAQDETDKAEDEAAKAQDDEAAKAQDEADRQRIFKSFDSNGDGQISASELEIQLKKLGKVSQDEIKNMMTEIDTDGDGFISFQEFTDFAKANSGLIRDVAKLF